jgi:hypothetical protein
MVFLHHPEDTRKTTIKHFLVAVILPDTVGTLVTCLYPPLNRE